MSWRITLAVRARLLLARHPALHWVVVAACAVSCALVAGRTLASLEDTRARWGTTRTVAVVVTPTAAGATPVVEMRSLPLAVLPDSAVVSVPTDVVAAHALTVGEIVVEEDLVPGTLARGVRLAVPADGAPLLAVGATAIIIAGGGTECRGVVAAVDEDWIDVVVPERCASTVALGLLAGDVVLAAAQPGG